MTPDGERVKEPGTELCRFAMGCQTLVRKSSVALARLERVVTMRPDGTRQHDAWKFIAMGNPIKGSTPRVVAKEISFLADPKLKLLETRNRGADGQYHDDEAERAKLAAAERDLPKDENGRIDYSRYPLTRLFEESDTECCTNAFSTPIDVTNRMVSPRPMTPTSPSRTPPPNDERCVVM